ncbi:MAG: hypothetical protein M3N45_04945 [Actinomycetota bacterium]|nr:hypothetical protein [Actinomycetota bacterium]
MTIQTIGKSPNAIPASVEFSARLTGIPYTSTAMTRAVASDAREDQCAATRKTASSIKSTAMGMIATSVESTRLSATGVYNCSNLGIQTSPCDSLAAPHNPPRGGDCKMPPLRRRRNLLPEEYLPLLASRWGGE